MNLDEAEVLSDVVNSITLYHSDVRARRDGGGYHVVYRMYQHEEWNVLEDRAAVIAFIQEHHHD